MVGGEKVSNFEECLSFFNIPEFSFEMLSYSEQKLFRICVKFFSIRDFDLGNLDLTGLDKNNQRKVTELILQILGSSKM
ncbi:hypothetical protein QIT30_gp01 [Saccharolobus solfataricus rod-shaped virus 1]|uniref:Uncharacterized protein n=1 Tax=Saccharolobus solfataricus rod-shaped virus 1 TaxID=2730619 RepID=A0A6M3VXB3_SSRV1|nr:hypothetical protein QIT30_gp01 [Saccharolobus solfataricus rod-shaped virus 1]QJF12277.1 hypothetical protein SSRV1_gp01 [Saccharolobus solfataricus rod-shaped virus 1]